MLTPYQTQQVITALFDGKTVAVIFPTYGAMRFGMFWSDKSLLSPIRSGSFYASTTSMNLLGKASSNQPDGTVSVGSGIAYGLAADNLSNAVGLEFDEVINVDAVDFVRPVETFEFCGKLRLRQSSPPAVEPVPAAEPTPTLTEPDRFAATAYGHGPYTYELCDDGETFESGRVSTFAEIDSRFSAFRKLRQEVPIDETSIRAD